MPDHSLKHADGMGVPSEPYYMPDGAHAVLGRQTLFWSGIGMLGLGFASIAYPGVSSLVAEQFIAWTFVMFGIVGVLTTIALHKTRAVFPALLATLVPLVLGAFLLFNPAAGLVALTAMISAMLIIEGAFQLAFALEIRPDRGWSWIALSAVFSLVAGVIFAAGLPASSRLVLGVLLAINFISTGIAFIALSRALRRAERRVVS